MAAAWLSSVGTTIADAFANAGRLGAALVTCGLLLAGGSVGVGLSKRPRGVFLGHSSAYYGLLIALGVFGLVETIVGFIVSGSPEKRRRLGLGVLCVSVLPVSGFAGIIWADQ